ncbi:MAG: Fur family transcriptional regulator [Pseudomonadota bacterium]
MPTHNQHLDQPFVQHDHDSCISRVSDAVETACKAQGLRLTKIRRQVLEILLQEHKALGAYDVLEHLAKGGQAAHPPVAYRALDFLVANGFAHKIERLNAFVACLHPGEGHHAAFMICRSCRKVAETDIHLDDSALIGEASRLGFQMESAIVEAEGLCHACAAA